MDDHISSRGTVVSTRTIIVWLLRKLRRLRRRVYGEPYTVCVETNLSGDLKWRPAATRGIIFLPKMQQLSLLEISIFSGLNFTVSLTDSNVIACEDGTTVPISGRCDTFLDCDGGIDEKSCEGEFHKIEVDTP